MRPVPAGRQRGQCCTPYSRLQEEIDNVETIAVTANNTANNAANAANIAMAGLTDGSVTKIGTANVGTNTKPIKLVGGVPTIVANELMDLNSQQTVTAEKTFMDSPILVDTPLIFDGNQMHGIVSRDTGGNRSHILFDTNGKIILQPGEQGGGVNAAVIDNQRAYDPANTDDIMTIGTMQQAMAITKSSPLTGISVITYGKIVIVNIVNLALNTGTGQNILGANTLPTFTGNNIQETISTANMDIGQAYVRPNGSMRANIVTAGNYYGTIVYIAD